MARITPRSGSTFHDDETTAIAEIAKQTGSQGLAAVILFCSPRYNLERLGAAIAERYQDCPVMACTTAGEIISGLGYCNDGIVGVGLKTTEMKAHLRLIHPLDRFDDAAGSALAAELRRELTLADHFDPARMFGFLLIDGMSVMEEQVTANIFNRLQGVPLIGGSAGDKLDFNRTYVYHQGRFYNNAAVFALFETTLPFKTFRIQHFEPTETRLVITEADSARRIVYEINGVPAADEYARAVGLKREELTPLVFAAHPLMLRISGEYFVRAIQKANDDGSLSFFCAIDTGLVLTVGRGKHLLNNLKQNIERLRQEVPGLQLIVGCDCILRRLELLEEKALDEVPPVLAGVNFIGFSTYGEQFNGIHVNQTLTGLALGG